MIPADVINRSQTSADVSLRPVAPTQEITDKIPGLAVGQRIMAEVQALLPNGTYRALVNQRNITLALPFSAKSGDALELQVTQSDGKLALAVIAHQPAGKAAGESAPSNLSLIGQLIGKLFSATKGSDAEAKAFMLNGNRPIVETPPRNAQDILPQLKEAIVRSGMFYESHQAEWVAGRFTKAALLQEPQGALSTLAQRAAQGDPALRQTNVQTGTSQQPPAANEVRSDSLSGRIITADLTTPQKSTAESAAGQMPGQLVAPQAQSLVHQQLAALANQHFIWQGQVWPGQDMRLAIEEESGHRHHDEEDSGNPWHTHLHLTFPNLGGIDAKLTLQGKQVTLSIGLANDASLSIVRSGSDSLRQQLHDAGLSVASIDIALQSGEPQ